MTEKPLLRVISLGAGVQSSTMALMATRGEIGPMPDCAVFADTQWEPRGTYDYLDKLEKQLPFPVYRTTEGSLLKRVVSAMNNGLFQPVPFYKVGSQGSVGIGRRQCTREFKITPVAKEIRRLLNRKRLNKKDKVQVWLGISLDEIIRQKPPRFVWQDGYWPLIDNRMTRSDCELWLTRNGYEIPPKSSCLLCPFRGKKGFLELKTQLSKEDWNKVLKVADFLESKGEFLLSCLTPLRQLEKATDGQINLFGNECEGMCGV